MQVEKMKKIKLKSKKDTVNLAIKIAKLIEKGDVIALYGKLGAGKTFLTQKLCKEIGVKEYVTSPSFVLLNQYDGDMPVYHFDLYRLSSIDEVLELGMDDFFEEGITIIEWPEIAEELLPNNTIKVELTYKNGDRYAILH